MDLKKLNEEIKHLVEDDSEYGESDEYKEYHFSFVNDDEGNVTIDADDYAGEYKEWNDKENGELMEDVIDIAKDNQIKDDIEENEGKEILYIDLVDFEYDEDDAYGHFILGVTFDV